MPTKKETPAKKPTKQPELKVLPKKDKAPAKKAPAAKKPPVVKAKPVAPKHDVPVNPYLRLEHLACRIVGREIGSPEGVALLDVGGAPGVVGLTNWKAANASVMVLDLDVREQPPGVGFTEGNGLDAEGLFGANSYDVVQSFEVLEHLTKEQGPKLLDALCAVARKFVIISTPNGFTKQGAVGGNPHQVHKCGWTAAELMALGFEVLMIGPDKIVAYKKVG